MKMFYSGAGYFLPLGLRGLKDNKYTLELNEVIKYLEQYNKTIFDFNYNLPEFMDKQQLEAQFINHYYFREIGQETIPRFLQRFQTKWLEMLQEYKIKFEAVYNNLTADNAINSFKETIQTTNDINDTENATNTMNLTPMSSLDPNKNYKTSVGTNENQKATQATLQSTRSGYNGGNVFKNINNMINDHTNVINNFINEFDYLFMGVL